MHSLSEPSFFLTNMIGALHGEWPGRIKPSLTTLLVMPLIPLAQQGLNDKELGRSMQLRGFVQHRTLVLNRVTILVGRPGTPISIRVLEATSSGTDPRSFVESTVLVKYPRHPLLSNF